jgi:4-aminobutyrate aminotransferase
VPEIVDIRGLGFMNAVEFNDVKKGLPSAEIANAIRLKALDKGLILLTCGVYGNVIRFLAPITIQDDRHERGARHPGKLDPRTRTAA